MLGGRMLLQTQIVYAYTLSEQSNLFLTYNVYYEEMKFIGGPFDPPLTIPAIDGSLLLYNSVVTAPIDLPQRPTVETFLVERRCATTT